MYCHPPWVRIIETWPLCLYGVFGAYRLHVTVVSVFLSHLMQAFGISATVVSQAGGVEKAL